MPPITSCFLNNFTKIIFGLFLFTAVLADERPKILTSIKPLALITQELTAGVAIDVDYLLPATISEHSYALKMSDVAKLKTAKLVVWLDKDMEPYLYKTEANWLVSSAPTKSLMLMPKLNFEGATTHDGEASNNIFDAADEHNHSIDPHVWLSPDLVQQLAEKITERLSERIPADQKHFEQNLYKFKQQIVAVDKSTAKRLAPYKITPFLVYHSAYGYFVRQYGLNQVGAMHIQPGAAMSLKQLAALQIALDRQDQAVCLFREPQFAGLPLPEFKTKRPIISGGLDPLGIEANSYAELIDNLTNGFIQCFAENATKKKKA